MLVHSVNIPNVLIFYFVIMSLFYLKVFAFDLYNYTIDMFHINLAIKVR